MWSFGEASSAGQSSGERRTNGGREKPNWCRGAQPRIDATITELKKRKDGRRSGGLDLSSALELQYAEHEVSDVLYSVPTMRQRNRDRNAQRRQSLQRLGNKATKRF